MDSNRIPLKDDIVKLLNTNFDIFRVECSAIYKRILIFINCDYYITLYVKYDPIQYNIKH
jgi:hypothetical protein